MREPDDRSETTSAVVEIRWRGTHAIVVISGEVDMASVEDIALAVRAVVAAQAHSVEIDAGRVEFIDVSGLRCIQIAAEAVVAAGRRFRLGAVSAPVRRLTMLVEPPGPDGWEGHVGGG